MRFFVRLVQRAAERRLRVPADYLDQMGRSSFSGFLKFLLFLPLAGHRRRSELSLAIASARVFPTVKRGLGFARSCSLVEIAVEPR